jgi:hypothetical protein
MWYGTTAMRMSRFLEPNAFLDEVKKLKAVGGHLSPAVLERLDEQRSLVPRLRLRYPDPVERRWWASAHRGRKVAGPKEPNGARWNAACALEKARQRASHRFLDDPTSFVHPLDRPVACVRQFVQRPARRKFVAWNDFRVEVGNGKKPFYTGNTVVTYYSSWQVLLFAEVVNMGVRHFLNLEVSGMRPSAEAVAAAPGNVSWEPVHAMRGFRDHVSALDAIVWFAEESQRGYMHATRSDDRSRRLLDDNERSEIMRTRRWTAREACRRYRVSRKALVEAVRFLAQRWAHWNHEGRPLIADAYKSVMAQAVRLACLAAGIEFPALRYRVGRAGGYLKPILDVVWTDWADEQRDYLRRVLVSMGQPDARVRAAVTPTLVDRFLDFVEANDLHSLYWRMDALHRHSFEGNDHSLEGLKAEVQGLAVVVEHLASALGATKPQLRDKFKELWASDAAVIKGLKDNAVIKVGNGTGIDMAWHEAQQGAGGALPVCADLAIAYAIRGGAHRVINEDNPLELEKMSLVLLRVALSTFEVAAAAQANEVA